MRDVTSEDPPNRELRVLGAPRLGKVAVDGGGHGFSPLSQQKPPSSRILRRQFELAQGLCEPGLLGGGWRVEACRRFDTRPDMDYGMDSGPGEGGGPLVPSQPSRRAGPWASSLPGRRPSQTERAEMTANGRDKNKNAMSFAMASSSPRQYIQKGTMSPRGCG